MTLQLLPTETERRSLADYTIPEPARTILEHVAPALLQRCSPERITLGGGTALAARWGHRRSADVGLFMGREDFRVVRSGRWPGSMERTGMLTYEEGQGWCRGSFSNGGFTISATEPLLSGHVVPADREASWRLRLEAVDEILAKKLRLRMYGDGKIAARDFHDICTAAEEKPAALERALAVLSPRQRGELAAEVRSLGLSAKGRTLVMPCNPDRTLQLSRKVAELLKHGLNLGNWMKTRSRCTSQDWQSMALNVAAIREEFARLERTDGQVRLDRAPTREDIHARWHWRRTIQCRQYGEDLEKFKIGRESFLAGGKGAPILKSGEPPLEWRFRYDPMPLDWFDHPAGRDILAPMDPEHRFLHHVAGKHLAGWADRPSGTEMFDMLVNGARDDDDR